GTSVCSSTAETTKSTCSRSRSAVIHWSRRKEPTRTHRAARGLHQSLSLSGDKGEAGTEPRQRTGEDRAHRNSARGEYHPFHFPAAEAQRALGCGVLGAGEKLRSKRGVS